METLGRTYDFSYALQMLKDGFMITRQGWNGKNQFIKLQRVDKESKMTKDYIYFSDNKDILIPWVASQSDLLAEDWEVAF